MSDITSAYNVATNIYLLPQFNQLCGFTEEEIGAVLQQIADEKGIKNIDQTLAMMRAFYNGYRFAEDSPIHLYNPTMALYFLRHFFNTGLPPKEILDNNLAMDSNKIHYIAELTGGADVIGAALDDAATLTIPQISERFGVRRMISEAKDTSFFASLLYYLGALTLTTPQIPGKISLRIPNLVMRRLYVEEMRDALAPDFRQNDFEPVSESLYMRGEIAPLCTLLEQGVFKAFSNRDYRWSNEMTLKAALLTVLFNDRLFIMDSEPEITRRYYADLTMIVRPGMRHFDIFDILLELKFIQPKAIPLSSEQIVAASDADLHALAPVQAAFHDANQQLQIYAPRLQNKYGDSMKLCAIAIVAIGFDRLLWQTAE